MSVLLAVALPLWRIFLFTHSFKLIFHSPAELGVFCYTKNKRYLSQISLDIVCFLDYAIHDGIASTISFATKRSATMIVGSERDLKSFLIALMMT